MPSAGIYLASFAVGCPDGVLRKAAHIRPDSPGAQCIRRRDRRPDQGLCRRILAHPNAGMNRATWWAALPSAAAPSHLLPSAWIVQLMKNELGLDGEDAGDEHGRFVASCWPLRAESTLTPGPPPRAAATMTRTRTATQPAERRRALRAQRGAEAAGHLAAQRPAAQPMPRRRPTAGAAAAASPSPSTARSRRRSSRSPRPCASCRRRCCSMARRASRPSRCCARRFRRASRLRWPSSRWASRSSRTSSRAPGRRAAATSRRRSRMRLRCRWVGRVGVDAEGQSEASTVPRPTRRHPAAPGDRRRDERAHRARPRCGLCRAHRIAAAGRHAGALAW